MGSISPSFEDRPPPSTTEVQSPSGVTTTLASEGGESLSVEPPLVPNDSSSASSSPTQPTFSWSAPPRPSPSTEPSQHELGLAPSSILSSQSHPNTPPLVPRDPFDDGAVSFAHDPFANVSDPDEGGDTPPPLSTCSPGGTTSVLEGDSRRKRSGTVSGLGLVQGERPATVVSEAFAYDVSSSEEEDRPSAHGRHLQPPAPSLVRAVSAPVQPARLGNLIHPTRRPSQSSTRASFAGRPPMPNHPSSTFSISSDSRLLPQHRDSISSDVSVLRTQATADLLDEVGSTSSGPFSPEQPSASGLYTLTLELADSVQAAIQTLLQVTPPHLFDSAKEQLSSCSVQMPATSLSSLLTAMKNLNYLSEHIAPLCTDESLNGSPSNSRSTTLAPRSRTLDLDPPASPSTSAGPAPLMIPSVTPPTSMDSQMSLASEGNSLVQEFDVGEILQSVGDLLGGMMAEAGVDLVLYHGDVGMKHFSVKGDEGGICYVLSHVIRQILLVSKPGDAIEIGLHVTPQRPFDSMYGSDSFSPRKRTLSTTSDAMSTHSQVSSPSGNEPGNALFCVFEIIHNVAPRWDNISDRTPKIEKAGTPNQGGGESFPGLTGEAGARLRAGNSASVVDGDIETRALLPPLPHLDSPLTTRLIKHVSASLRTEGDRSSIRRKFELSLLLERGSALLDQTPLTAQEEAARQPFASVKLAREPTLAELMVFAETLRGKKVALHASETSAFARHITSYLTAWGMDMRHISTERDDEEFGNEYLGSNAGTPKDENKGVVPSTYHDAAQGKTFETSPLAGNDSNNPLTPSERVDTLDKDAGASFIMIDDDIEVLKRRLRQLRVQALSSMTLRTKSKRPSLSSRARSSPHVRQLMTPLTTEPASPPKRGVIIVHFTSLSNYSNVRDCIQSIFTPGLSSNSLPEVIVIPKPVGPRRFLTALHTAINRPIVDPFFTPIATSPLSPSGSYGSSYGYFPPPLASAPSPSQGSGFPGRETLSRRSPAGELQTSPLDHQKVTSPGSGSGSARGSRIKSPQVPAPGVLTHRPSSHNASGSAHPRSPNTENAPNDSPVAPNVPITSPVAMPMSPPRHLPPPTTSTKPGHSTDPSAPPPAKEKKKVRKAPKEDGVVVPPINVLIVEDNPINQTILSTFMKKRKIKYGVAKDGREAVDKWRTGGFHLILMDIQLPVMDGIEATREIRRLEKSQNIGIFPLTPTSEVVRTPSPSKENAPASPFRSSVIIVALTASSLQSDRVSALAAGCNDFLTKPVSLKWLEKKIVEWGCMQALIDFEGWRRWRVADKSEASDTTRGFDAQAKTLRSRLRIERRAPRSTSSVSGTATPPVVEQEDPSSSQPAINVVQPTPARD